MCTPNEKEEICLPQCIFLIYYCHRVWSYHFFVQIKKIFIPQSFGNLFKKNIPKIILHIIC